MTILDRALSREVLAEHDGRSGATLERVVLDDGTRLIVKTADPNNDLTMAATGNVDRELRLFASGALDRLRDGVGHPIVEMWRDDATVTTVMRDLGDTIPGWSRVITQNEVARIADALGAMHREFLSQPPPDLCPLPTRLGLLSRETMRALPAGPGEGLPAAILHGWDCFAAAVDPDVRDAVFALHADPARLADALDATGPRTLCHADLWLVNLALEADQVTLLDWAIATEAPPVLDLAVFLTGAAANMACTREEAIARFQAASPSCSDDAVALGLVFGLCDMGWNKAMDALEHDDPAMRARERADLDWWIAAARDRLLQLAA